MKYMIDGADISAIKKIIKTFPIVGVTTNPTIVSKTGLDLKTIVTNIRKVIGYDKMLHVQALESTADGIVEQAHRIVDFSGENTYVKIPVTADGFEAMMRLSEEGVNITATAIFTPQQALMAATAGAKFVAPYVNRLDNISASGTDVAGEIQQLLKIHNMDCEVLAASFNNVEQIHKTIMSGVTCVTINTQLFYKLIYHPLTDLSVAEFIDNGTPYYNL